MRDGVALSCAHDLHDYSSLREAGFAPASGHERKWAISGLALATSRDRHAVVGLMQAKAAVTWQGNLCCNTALVVRWCVAAHVVTLKLLVISLVEFSWVPLTAQLRCSFRHAR
jgi:hypothetical protein